MLVRAHEKEGSYFTSSRSGRRVQLSRYNSVKAGALDLARLEIIHYDFPSRSTCCPAALDATWAAHPTGAVTSVAEFGRRCTLPRSRAARTSVDWSRYAEP
jgi:hypothetical protein